MAGFLTGGLTLAAPWAMAGAILAADGFWTRPGTTGGPNGLGLGLFCP